MATRHDTVAFDSTLGAAGISIGVSLLLIALGLTAVLAAGAAGLAISILILWIIIFSGVAHLVHAWDARQNPLFVWRLLVGILYVVAGVVLLVHPGFSLAYMTLFIAGMLVLESMLLFGAYSWLQGIPGTGWIALDGTLTLLLAGIVAFLWPWTSNWLLGVVVGVNLISTGATRLALTRGRGGPVGRAPV